jgi:hypothetical protein
MRSYVTLCSQFCISTNIRECVRIARLSKNDSLQVNRIIDTFAKYGSGMTDTM